MKLTAAQRRALEAVRDGKAYRTYTAAGNTMAAPGIGAATLWRLEQFGMIRDGVNRQHGLNIHTCLELTDNGRKTLWHED